MSTVELRDFGWRHAGRRSSAVSGLDLAVGHGERVLLLGTSGAGKSTVLHAMAGLLADDSGEQTGHVLVDGVDARQRRDRVGVLFQDPQTQLVMARSGDDVAFGLENRGLPTEQIWPRVRDALAATGFRYPLDHPTHALSGGEQQRLALAGVLALRPGLLLLDEPTANLDPDGAATIMDGLRRATADGDTTLILIEHRVDLAIPLVDRVVAIAPGGDILADGPPSTIFADGRLARHGVWTPGGTAHRRRSPTPGPVVLRGDDLHLRYPGADRDALAKVDVALAAGTVTCVEGGNGSGKSTLAHVLGGLIAPTTGTVTFTDTPTRGGLVVPGSTPAHCAESERRPRKTVSVDRGTSSRRRTLIDVLGGPTTPWRQLVHKGGSSGAPHRMRAAALAQRIGSVFQNPEHQFVTATVADELAVGPRAAHLDDAETRRRVDDLLDRLHLAHLAQANPFTLSGGEARRLSVATALANAPDVLILDEPTFGQDRHTWDELVDLLAALRADGAAILAVTHDPLVVDALADQRLRLDRGTPC